MSYNSSSSLPRFTNGNPYPNNVQAGLKKGLNLQTYSLAKILMGIILLATIFSIPHFASMGTSSLVSAGGGTFISNEYSDTSNKKDEQQLRGGALKRNAGIDGQDNSMYREK